MDHDYGTAYYKAQLAAGNRLPTKGTVFLSIRDADKGRIVDIARKLRSTGLQLIGTGGTVAPPRGASRGAGMATRSGVLL